jgi:beta-lactamase regulating signal transducer with metallopeptidase domain
MNLEIFTNSSVIENLGWTLVHSIWQIAFAAFLLSALLRVCRNYSANARYLLAVAALALTFVLPLATFVWFTNVSSVEAFSNAIQIAGSEESFDNNYRLPEESSPFVKAETQKVNPQNGTAFLLNIQETFRANSDNILAFLVGFWFLGVMIFSFRLIGGICQIHRFKTREIAAPNVVWQEKFVALCQKLKITQSVQFVQSNLVETPVAVGWLKPLIIVPASLFLQINPRELETILAHELVHIRRYDNFVNLAQSTIEVLFFYHPGAWWISSQIKLEREFAADAAVTEIFNESRIVYASALANLETIRHNKQALPLATAADGGNLMQRIQKILQKNTEIKRGSSAWSALLALAFISAIMLGVFSLGDQPFVNAQTKTKGKKLAIGFVSIPPLDRTENAPKDADATARLVIAKLNQYKIPAIGFVQGSMISDGDKPYPVRANIVRLWRDAGFEIGIGGYKHIWFYKTPYDDYVANAEKNETVVKKILGEKNLPLRYFSYPYLNTGKTVEDKTRFENWLASRGLSSVKYTIDNQEWMYSYAYDMARNDNDINTMQEIRADFLDYMTKMFDHHEANSQEMFGRDIAQTMVLTPSRLITDSADDLFGMIKNRGYRFVSMDEALKDEAYQTPETFTGESGISWFDRWALTQKKRLRDEPRESAIVQKIWNETKKK